MDHAFYPNYIFFSSFSVVLLFWAKHTKNYSEQRTRILQKKMSVTERHKRCFASFIYLEEDKMPHAENLSAAVVRPRFFDQVGHETMYASSENKHFFH